MVGLCASTEEDMGVAPGQEIGILHAAWPKKKKVTSLPFFASVAKWE